MADKKITDLQLRSNVDDDVNFPIDDGIQTYRVTGPQVLDYVNSKNTQPIDARNYSLAASVSSSALTIALKNLAGSNASSTSPVNIAFRSSTLASGIPIVRSIIGALSTVISSGSTAGHKDGIAHDLYIYAIDHAGTVELAWSSTNKFDEGKLYSTTAEGGSGGADSGLLLYSTTARTSVAIRYLGRMVSSQTTAGTWSVVPTEISSLLLAKSSDTVAAIIGGTINTASVNTPLKFPTVLEDTHSAYDTSTGQFTAPFTGFYHVSTFVNQANHPGKIYSYLAGSLYLPIGFQGDNKPQSSGSCLVKATAGDTIDVRSDATVSAPDDGHLSIFKLP